MDGLRRIVHAIHAATRASQRTFGLSGAQLFVLRELAHSTGQSLSDLARRTRTTQGSVSEVVSRLVRQGLVAREASSVDRRRAVLTLTAEGQSVLERAPESVQARLLAGFTRLTEAEQQALADGLESWLVAAGLESTPAALFFEEPNRDLTAGTQ